MKCVKFLTISALLVSAPAVNAYWGQSYAEATTKYVKESSTGALKTVKEGTLKERGTLAAKTAGVTLVAGYALSKVWAPAQTAWEKCRLNKVTDKVEDTLKGAKENPRSKDGAIVGGAVVAGAFYYFGVFGKLKALCTKPKGGNGGNGGVVGGGNQP